MRSLFLVSLPRSLTSLTYHQLSEALSLREPIWTSDGEVLNLDRHALFPQESGAESRKFTQETREPDRFAQLVDFLKQATRAEGFIYKDVVQPFVTSSWLPASGMKTLCLTRDVPDVAYAMIERDWWYPSCASDSVDDREGSLIEGLLRARAALDRLAGPTLSFDRLIGDEYALWETVAKIYPDAELRPGSYIDEAFEEVRSEVMQRRETRKFRRLVARCEEIEAALKGAPQPPVFEP